MLPCSVYRLQAGIILRADTYVNRVMKNISADYTDENKQEKPRKTRTPSVTQRTRNTSQDFGICRILSPDVL